MLIIEGLRSVLLRKVVFSNTEGPGRPYKLALTAIIKFLPGATIPEEYGRYR